MRLDPHRPLTRRPQLTQTAARVLRGAMENRGRYTVTTGTARGGRGVEGTSLLRAARQLVALGYFEVVDRSRSADDYAGMKRRRYYTESYVVTEAGRMAAAELP